jgi:hypothetical protein
MSDGERRSSDERLGDGPSLNARDEELIIEQCKLQSATKPAEIKGMRDAFADAKRFAFEQGAFPIDPDDFAAKVLSWGEMVDSGNANGLRSLPVTFSDGSHGVAPDSVEDAMKSWAEAFIENRLTPEQAYHEFELIHPYRDGNGRTGHCIWALAEYRDSGTWPTKLPPDVFGDDRPSERPPSAFNEPPIL